MSWVWRADVDTVKRWLTDSHPTVGARQEFSGLHKLCTRPRISADQNIGKHAALTTV